MYNIVFVTQLNPGLMHVAFGDWIQELFPNQ